MLIRASIENFLSFNEPTEILLTPGRSRNLSDHIVRGEKSRDLRILKSAVIYGANASGKSNFAKALLFLKKRVVRPRRGKIITYEKFKLDKSAVKRRSQIELEFYYQGVNYAYGIVFDQQAIYEEWLYRFDKEKDWKIYERTTVDKKVEITFDHLSVSKKDRQRLQFIGADTLPHELFLHTANHRNIKDIPGVDPLLHAYAWFDEALTVIFPNSRFVGLEYDIDSDEDLLAIYEWFLTRLDTGIIGLKTIQVDFLSNDVKVPDQLKERISEDLDIGERAMVSSVEDNITYSLTRLESGDIEAVKLMTRHAIKNSEEEAYFEINEESDGTQRIMDFIPAMAELAKKEKVFVVDEINRSLHPKLTVKLMDLFFTLSKGRRSQLICTTHESQLMDQQKLRKDELWFVKKDKFGASTLYSLEEFRERKDVDIRTGYLKGRYDAVPSFSGVAEPPWDET